MPNSVEYIPTWKRQQLKERKTTRPRGLARKTYNRYQLEAVKRALPELEYLGAARVGTVSRTLLKKMTGIHDDNKFQKLIADHILPRPIRKDIFDVRVAIQMIKEKTNK